MDTTAVTDTIDPRTAQAAARLGLRLAGHVISPGLTIALTTGVPGYGPATSAYTAQQTQVETAVELFQTATGRVIPAQAVLAALPWERTIEDGAT